MTQSNLTFTESPEIPKGYKKTEICNIPEDWLIQKFKDCCIKIQDGNYGAFYPKSNEFLSYGIPFLTSKVLGKSGRINYDKIDYISEEKHLELKKAQLKLDDVLLTNRGGSVGAVALVNAIIQHGNIGPQLTLLRVNGCVKSNYLYQYMKSNLFQNQISEIDSGSAMNFFGIKATENFQIPFPPSLDEQQKIATALSDTDALISELEKLIEKKQAIKTATMQQLLTGKTRLPEFALREDGTPKGYKDSELGQIPENWGVYPLKSLLKSQPKYGINAAATQLSGDLPTYIRITDIDENGKFNPSEKVGVDSPLSGNYILEQGDIVLARTGASVGKSYLYDKDDGELVYAGFLIKISPAPNLLCSKYLSIYLQTKEYWDWIATNSMRSGQPGINGNQYASLKIVLPSFNEQLKISRIFKDIDRDLEQLKIKLDKVTLLKQGMMQELLTGKTRLV